MFHFTGYRDYVRRAAVALGLDSPIIPGMAQVGGLVPLTRLASLIGQMAGVAPAAHGAIFAAARTSEDALALAALAAQAMLAAAAAAYGLEPPSPRLVAAADLAAALARVHELEAQLAALAPGANDDDLEPESTSKGRKRPKG